MILLMPKSSACGVSWVSRSAPKHCSLGRVRQAEPTERVHPCGCVSLEVYVFVATNRGIVRSALAL